MSANEERGEVAMELGGERFVLRPTYEAIQAVEAALGRGLVDLGQSALNGKLGTDDAAIVATEFIKAQGRATGNKSMAAVNAKKVGSLMFEADGGFTTCLGIVGAVLAMAATGGYTATGELKAAERAEEAISAA